MMTLKIFSDLDDSKTAWVAHPFLLQLLFSHTALDGNKLCAEVFGSNCRDESYVLVVVASDVVSPLLSN